MDWLSFWATIVKAVVWPITVLIALHVFRAKIGAVLPSLVNRLHSARWPGGELTFGQRLEKLEEELPASSLVHPDAVTGKQEQASSPSAYVLEYWGIFIDWLRAEVAKRGLGMSQEASPRELVDALTAENTPIELGRLAGMVLHMQQLRNRAADRPDEVQVADAVRFGYLLRIIRSALKATSIA